MGCARVLTAKAIVSLIWKNCFLQLTPGRIKCSLSPCGSHQTRTHGEEAAPQSCPPCRPSALGCRDMAGWRIWSAGRFWRCSQRRHPRTRGLASKGEKEEFQSSPQLTFMTNVYYNETFITNENHTQLNQR